MKFIVITLLFLISFSGCIGDNDAVGKKTDTKDDSTKTLSQQQPSEIVPDPIISTTLNSDPTESTVEPPKPSENTTTTTPTPDPIPTTVPTSTTPVPNPNVTTTTVLPPSPNVTTTTIAPNPNVTTTTIAPSPNVTTTTISPSPNVTTTTIAPNPNVTTTVAPPVTTTKRPTPTPCRRFDGPSFIGGIVLAVGLMAISVVAYKFYKARTDRNYHTL